MSNNPIPNSNLSANSYISQDWTGGYKLEVELTAKENTSDWQLDFELPYSIRDIYGADLTNNGNDDYSISGVGAGEDLASDETTKVIFIIDDYNQEAIIPQFSVSGASTSNDHSLMGSVVSDPQPAQPAESNSDVISVDFEDHSNYDTYDYSAQSKDWNVAWSNQMERYASISNEEAHSGNNSLKIDYPADQQSNAGANWQIPDQKEYYLSYWLKFENNFDFDGPEYSGGKLPGLGAGDLASGGKKPNGDNGFTSRYMWRENGKATLYLYHMDQPGTYGEDLLLKDSQGNDKYFEPGQWHNMVQRVRINDGSQANGEIDVWMDNEKVLDVDNLRFVTNGQQIDTMFFSTFHGGNGSDWWPEREVNAYFDDFVVSTNAADVGL